jgi:hypothetical protein
LAQSLETVSCVSDKERIKYNNQITAKHLEAQTLNKGT